MRDKLIDITMASELIICLVLPVLCSIMVLQWQRDQIYQKIKSERIAWASPDEMICLKFSSSDTPQISGKKSSQTIEYLGDSYHIVQTETVGDTTFFWCLSELNTINLTEAYEDLLARELGRSSQRQKQKSLLFNYFQSLYFEIIAIELYESFAYLEGDEFHENTLAYAQPFSSPPAPPPKS
jgi:hypothetical protein